MTKCFLAVLLLTGQLSFGQTTITMQKENGVYVVPCRVNGLNLKFIFDTEASGVSISLTEALFMLGNGYLNTDDILDSAYNSDVNEDIIAGTRINLREIEFGGITLHNVQASAVDNIKAPILIGQTALAKLIRIQPDFTKGTLTIINIPNRSSRYSKTSKGLVKCEASSPILDKPDNLKGNQIGTAKNSTVEIIYRVNEKFYYVKSDTVKGYMDSGYFKN